MSKVQNSFDFTVLRQLRKKRGLNFDILSQKSGISKPTLHSIESGKNVPTLPTLNSIANALEISTMDFLNLAHVPGAKINEVENLGRLDGTEDSNAVYAVDSDLHSFCVKAAPGDVIDGRSLCGKLNTPYRVMCIVVEGELKVSVGDKEYHARKGNYVCFSAINRYSYSAAGNDNCRFVLVHSTENIFTDLETIVKGLSQIDL